MADMNYLSDGTNTYNVRDAQAETLLINNAPKNLLHISDVYTSKSNVDGIDYTLNRNEAGEMISIVANGTASGIGADYWITMNRLGYNFPNGKYIFSSGIEDNHNNQFGMWYLLSGDDYNYMYSSEEIITVTDNVKFMGFYVHVEQNAIADNWTAAPMMRKAEITDGEFEPYYRSQKQLDADLSMLEQQIQALTSRVEVLENG